MNVISTDRWKNISPNARRASLQNLEYREADSQGRFPASVNSSDSMQPNEHGAYDPDTNQIDINSNLLAADSPSQALGTYFHEERHAQQHNASRFPELSDNPEQAREWGNNFDNYIEPQDDFEGYYNQPVEKDARDYSAQRLGEFQAQDASHDRFTHEPSLAETRGRNLWQHGTEDSRLSRLQDVENYNADVHNRPPLTLEAQDMPDSLSRYDPERDVLGINSGTLRQDTPDSAYDAYKNGLGQAAEHDISQHHGETPKAEAQSSEQNSQSQGHSDGKGYGL